MSGAPGTRDPVQRPGLAKDNKDNNDALESPKGYIVLGCWELKRKFRLGRVTNPSRRVNERCLYDMFHQGGGYSRSIKEPPYNRYMKDQSPE
jgi:hypothetical protein